MRWLVIALVACGGSRTPKPVEQPVLVEPDLTLTADFAIPSSNPTGEPIAVPLFKGDFERTRERKRRDYTDGVETEVIDEVIRERFTPGRLEVTYERGELSGTYVLAVGKDISRPDGAEVPFNVGIYLLGLYAREMSEGDSNLVAIGRHALRVGETITLPQETREAAHLLPTDLALTLLRADKTRATFQLVSTVGIKLHVDVEVPTGRPLRIEWVSVVTENGALRRTESRTVFTYR